jgi:hypothetical protein
MCAQAAFFPTAGVLPNIMKKYSIVGLIAGVVADRYSGASHTVDSDAPKVAPPRCGVDRPAASSATIGRTT